MHLECILCFRFVREVAIGGEGYSMFLQFLSLATMNEGKILRSLRSYYSLHCFTLHKRKREEHSKYQKQRMDSLNKMLVIMNCPYTNSFCIDKHDDVVKLVFWLEDQKIGLYDPNSGERAQKLKDDANWDSKFNDYMSQLCCPFSWPENKMDCLFWLVTKAIDYTYEDASKAGSLAVNDAKIDEISIDSIGKTINCERIVNESDAGEAC
jgi:hypothetical protein